MSKTLLQRIKDKEVTQVVSERYGVSTKIELDTPTWDYPIDVTFESGTRCTFSKDGYRKTTKDPELDIYPYNDPESVQEIKMPDPDAIPPQPTIEEFAEWVVANQFPRRAIELNCTSKELIELFKQSKNEST